MPRRVEPRANWRATLDGQADPYNDAQHESIAAELDRIMDRSLTESERARLREEVAGHARDFLEARHQFQGPGREEIRVALMRLKKAAESFRSAVAELDDYSIALLRMQNGWFQARLSELAEAGLSPAEIASTNALGPVDQISTEAEQALSRLEDGSEPSPEELLSLTLDFTLEPDGRRRRNPVEVLVYGLLGVFRRVTGREPNCHATDTFFHGNCLDFVGACLKPIDDRCRGKPTLGTTVRSVIREQRHLGYTRIE